jgi:hypothetical protein
MAANRQVCRLEDSRAAEGFDFLCRIADSRFDRQGAFRLTYEKYLQAGLIRPRQHPLRVTPYHLLPATSIFVATNCTGVLCTVTLIGDSPCGLPMESAYAAEVEERRQRRLSLGEVSCLAFESMPRDKFLTVLVQLTRLMAQHARFYGMDQFLIAVHPQHARFYSRYMGFEQIGPLRSYPVVRGAPAVACCLDFATIDRNHPRCYATYFGTPLPVADLIARPMDESDRDWFRPYVERDDDLLQTSSIAA